MDVNYLYSNVFVFLLMSKNKKAENSVKIYATLVKRDQNQLKQVFINLIKNAVESMPDGGTVDIIITEDEHSVHVTVKDEGEGIPEKVLNRIGEPFLTTKEKGTGLGLMVTFNIIENHQGVIHVDSHPEKGTAFKISFPKNKTTA
ncbi:hypothetical protein CJZ71_20300 [Bacillus subtilis]|nr:hypothetical protein CJZ71_20300 [Bacillus subtilis]